MLSGSLVKMEKQLEVFLVKDSRVKVFAGTLNYKSWKNRKN
jgi:hypothetical protein